MYRAALAAVIILVMLTAACTFAPPPSAQSWQKLSLDNGPEVKVRIWKNRYFNEIMLKFPENQVLLSDGQGNQLSLPEKTRRVYIKKKGDGLLLAFKPGQWQSNSVTAWHEFHLRTVDQNLKVFTLAIPYTRLRRDYDAKAWEVSIKYNRMAVIDKLPLEAYIARVVPAEMEPNHFTLESLKAQAVVARTWALRNLRRHLRFGYNFCDSPHCQVYRGRKWVSPRAEAAAKMTMGEVLSINNKIVDAFYHSTCGGNTVFVNEAWAGPLQSHLVRVEDRWQPGHRPYCANSPYFQWNFLTTLARMERLLKKEHQLQKGDKLTDVQVYFVNRSGRVLKIKLVTKTGEKLMDDNVFRGIINKAYHKRKLLSSFYSIAVHSGQLKVRGHGLGHGVGMCQWGARGMAQHGFDYVAILQHYFKGVTLKKLYGFSKTAASGLTSKVTSGRK